MALSTAELVGIGLFVFAIIVLGILFIVKMFKIIILVVLLAVIGYLFYSGYIHL